MSARSSARSTPDTRPRNSAGEGSSPAARAAVNSSNRRSTSVISRSIAVVELVPERLAEARLDLVDVRRGHRVVEVSEAAVHLRGGVAGREVLEDRQLDDGSVARRQRVE